MFGLLKFLFFTFVAVVVGLVIGTVPIGGRTVAERIASIYERVPPSIAHAGKKTLPAMTSTKARATTRAKPAAPSVPVPVPVPSAAAPATHGVITAGAANTPDAHSEDDKVALDKLIAARVKPR